MKVDKMSKSLQIMFYHIIQLSCHVISHFVIVFYKVKNGRDSALTIKRE